MKKEIRRIIEIVEEIEKLEEATRKMTGKTFDETEDAINFAGSRYNKTRKEQIVWRTADEAYEVSEYDPVRAAELYPYATVDITTDYFVMDRSGADIRFPFGGKQKRAEKAAWVKQQKKVDEINKLFSDPAAAAKQIAASRPWKKSSDGAGLSVRKLPNDHWQVVHDGTGADILLSPTSKRTTAIAIANLLQKHAKGAFSRKEITRVPEIVKMMVAYSRHGLKTLYQISETGRAIG